jgi:hypothetical protein
MTLGMKFCNQNLSLIRLYDGIPKLNYQLIKQNSKKRLCYYSGIPLGGRKLSKMFRGTILFMIDEETGEVIIGYGSIFHYPRLLSDEVPPMYNRPICLNPIYLHILIPTSIGKDASSNIVFPENC